MQSWASLKPQPGTAHPQNFANFTAPRGWGEGEQDVEAGRQQVARGIASLQRRVASLVSYVNCLQELQEAVQRLPKKQPAEARLCGCICSASYFNRQDRKYIPLIGYPPADSAGSMGRGSQFENGRMPTKSHVANGAKAAV